MHTTTQTETGTPVFQVAITETRPVTIKQTHTLCATDQASAVAQAQGAMDTAWRHIREGYSVTDVGAEIAAPSDDWSPETRARFRF